MQESFFTVYIAPRGFEHELAMELARKGQDLIERRERLFLCKGSPLPMAWAQNTWLNPHFLRIRSIKDAACQLKGLQRNWALHEGACLAGVRRRAALVRDALPYVSFKPLIFGTSLPQAPLGSWTMWESELILASPQCSSPFADGEVFFEENKVDPPNRAYLKLWEVFTLLPKGGG